MSMGDLTSADIPIFIQNIIYWSATPQAVVAIDKKSLHAGGRGGGALLSLESKGPFFGSSH